MMTGSKAFNSAPPPYDRFWQVFSKIYFQLKMYTSKEVLSIKIEFWVGRGGRECFVRDDELESDDRSPLVSRSNPVAAAFAFANLRKRDFRRLHLRVRG